MADSSRIFIGPREEQKSNVRVRRQGKNIIGVTTTQDNIYDPEENDSISKALYELFNQKYFTFSIIAVMIIFWLMSFRAWSSPSELH